MEKPTVGKKRTRVGAMEISIKKMNGKTVNLEVDDSFETIDLKIHGPTRKVVIRLGPESDEDEEAVIRLIVSTLGGKTYNLIVKENETIANVKAKILGQGGPPVNDQRLLYEGNLLRDNLLTCGVKTGSTLVMMSNRCGC